MGPFNKLSRMLFWSPLLLLAIVSETVVSQQTIEIWQPNGAIADTFASYEQVEEINHSLNSKLNDLLHNTDFFGYYRLDLYGGKCPVSWNDAFPMCGNRACAVDTLNEVCFLPHCGASANSVNRKIYPGYGKNRSLEKFQGRWPLLIPVF